VLDGASWPGKVNALILPKDGSVEDGSIDFSSLCSGLLRVCWTGLSSQLAIGRFGETSSFLMNPLVFL
jgi:hypothetical protein